jgi:hypothetical protein
VCACVPDVRTPCSLVQCVHLPRATNSHGPASQADALKSATRAARRASHWLELQLAQCAPEPCTAVFTGVTNGGG